MFQVVDRPGNLSKLAFKKKIEKIVLFFKLNFFIINNFLDQFRIYHRKGHFLNFKNMSLSIFSVANSISYTASKTGVSFTPLWPLNGYIDRFCNFVIMQSMKMFFIDFSNFQVTYY